MTTTRQLLGFLLVGGAGFGVDTLGLYLLLSLGADLYSARLVSFLLAATFTWWGNRKMTFSRGLRRHRASPGEWGRYVSAMGLGGLINLGVYAVLVAQVGWVREAPWVGVAAGTLAGMTVNFLVARRLLWQRG